MAKTIKAAILNENGTIEIRDMADELSVYQTIVGGNIEVVRSRALNCAVVIDEEGRFKSYNFNLNASLIAGCDIVGNAVLVNFTFEGEFVSLREDQIDFIKGVYGNEEVKE